MSYRVLVVWQIDSCDIVHLKSPVISGHIIWCEACLTSGMNKEPAYAIEELEILHAALVELENQGNHKVTRLRWAVGWVIDEVVGYKEPKSDFTVR